MQPRAAGREPDVDNQTPEQDRLGLGITTVRIIWWFDGPCLHFSCTHMRYWHTLLSNVAMSNLFLWENTCMSDHEHTHSRHFLKPYGGLIHSKKNPRKIFTTTTHFPSLRVLEIQAAIVAI